jgi:hypothetical protein
VHTWVPFWWITRQNRYGIVKMAVGDRVGFWVEGFYGLQKLEKGV